ncbi:BCCIP homolog [Babesia caballi]|uniref:BCCIP homolog n=1 Tax=Babesia caballi TaxID=5871 RepID=A0AAV4M222_BABCB|nr:BCCIP homolog [Babesia caballi]
MEKMEERVPERASKKRKPDQTNSDEESDGPMEADFLFNDPAPEDYDGILAIIQGYLKKVPWELPKGSMDTTYGVLAQLISEQPNLGTLVKTEDDEGEDAFVMAVLSVLNIKMYDQLSSLRDTIIALTKQHGSQQDLDAMTKLLTEERNQWSLDNADEEERQYYKLTHLVGISRVFTDNAKHFNAKHMVYVKPEERFYCEEAIVKFMWSTGESNKVDFYEDGDESKPTKTRVVPEAMMLYCVPIGKYQSVVRKIVETFV